MVFDDDENDNSDNYDETVIMILLSEMIKANLELWYGNHMSREHGYIIHYGLFTLQ